MKILCICYANVCRSFMAQEFFKHHLPQAEVFSRGLYADPSFKVPQKVYRALTQHGLTPLPHRPAALTKEDLARADFIFCMEQAHLDLLSDRYAQYSAKLWLLTQAAGQQPQDIADPIAWEGADFKRAAERLAQTVAACAARLAKNPQGETLGS